ncbi:MAG: HEAT repeat domain-containing protein [Fimbriiglobus sp.]
MDISAKKLARLMKADQPVEIRGSAVVVAAELAVKDPDIAAEVIERITDESDAVRIQAIKAAGKLKLTKSLPMLMERLEHGGEEAKLAAEAAAKLGSEGVKRLQEMMHQVAPGLRRYIAVALTSAGSASSEAGVAVLLDRDPQVASAAASSLASRATTMTADQKKKLVKELLTLMTDKKVKQPLNAELSILKVLTALNDSSAGDVLWDRTIPPHPTELRAAALQTVGGWISETPTKEQFRRLFVCASDTHFSIVAPALMVLNKIPVAEKMLDDWTKLFKAPDMAARRLAMEKLGDRDTEIVADALMEQMNHPDRNLADLARKKLAKLEHGRQCLAQAVLDAKTNEEAWQLARSVSTFAASFSPKVRGAIFDQVCKFIETGDTRVDPLLFLLREADGTGLRDQLFDQAVVKRKKKDYEAALKYLRFLTRDPSSGYPIRLEAAMCGLKKSSKEIATESRMNDHCLRHFEQCLSNNASETIKQIEKAKWLDENDFFYLGFHFVEKIGMERDFGISMLKLVIKANPRAKLAANAKNKLKSCGAD